MTTNTKNLNDMTTAALVAMHNALSDGKPLKNWKGKKSDLIARVQKLHRPVAKIPRGALARFCIPLLKEVVGWQDADGNPIPKKTDGAVSVGHSYSEVLRRVRSQYPNTGHNYACLRWYVSKLREQGEDMPVARPVSRWKNKSDAA